MHNRFTVLTGGPGTGKTWALRNALTLKFISILLDFRSSATQIQGLKPSFPKAILAAPTGKAAARMTYLDHSPNAWMEPSKSSHICLQ